MSTVNPLECLIICRAQNMGNNPATHCISGHIHQCAGPSYRDPGHLQNKEFGAHLRMLLTLCAPGKRGPWGFFLSTKACPPFWR